MPLIKSIKKIKTLVAYIVLLYLPTDTTVLNLMSVFHARPDTRREPSLLYFFKRL